jgi:hypothetical protein
MKITININTEEAKRVAEVVYQKRMTDKVLEDLLKKIDKEVQKNELVKYV